MKISVITPGFNEGRKIKISIKKIISILNEHFDNSWELIFINDGSTDDTINELTNLEERVENFQIISYTNNRGRGYALKKGIKHAKGDFVLTTESDLNWGTTIIKNLYKEITQSGKDIIIASPHTQNGLIVNVPYYRKFLSKWGNKILSLSVNNKLTMLSGMTRIYKRECIHSLSLISNDKEIHLEIISKASALGYQIGEIPASVIWPNTVNKTGKKSSFNAKKYIFSHLYFSFFERPFMLFGIFGFTLLSIGLSLGFYILYLFYNNDLNPVRPIMTLLVLLILGGVFILSFGLIGMQINHLRKEVYSLQKKK